MIVPLDEHVDIKLDGTGAGTALIGPVNQFQVWHPTTAGCRVSSNASEPVFNLFSPQGNFISGSYTGSNDSTDLANIPIYPGQKLNGVWTGGDANATATLSIQGMMEVPDPPKART